MCSAASGADTLFAQEVLSRQAPLSVILPFDVARFQRDFAGEPADSWDRSREIIRRATHLDVVHQIESDLAGVAEDDFTPQQRADAEVQRNTLAYYEATIRTVERCDLLLAIWNEKPGTGIGGTAAPRLNTLKKLNKPIIIYNPEKDQLGERRISDLPAPQPQDLVDLSAPRQVVERHANALDEKAKAHAGPARGQIKKYIYLHLAASCAASAALIFGLFEDIRLVPAIAELAVLGVAWYLVWKRGTHFKFWLLCREEAEVCRTFLATWDVRRHPTLVRQPRPPLPGQDRLFRRLRLLREIDRSRLPSLDTVRENYIKHRIDDQIQYFKDKLVPARKSFRLYSQISKIASGASILAAIVVFGLVLTAGRHDVILRLFEWLGTVLPLVVTAASLLTISQESSRRNRRYTHMIVALEHARPTLAAAPTWDALARAVTEVEESLLQEIIEWQAFVETTEHLH